MENQDQGIVTRELEKYKAEGANILMPSIHIAGMSEFHSAVVETVRGRIPARYGRQEVPADQAGTHEIVRLRRSDLEPHGK
jgi:hypothetical protein